MKTTPNALLSRIRRSNIHLLFRVSLVTVAWLIGQITLAQTTRFEVPLTSDGVPDLQGIWTSNTITPLERDPRFGDQLVLSSLEAMALEQAVADYSANADAPSDPNRAAPNKGKIELADSYNNFWFDDGTRVAEFDGEYRSSLIIAPSDGRIPAYTPAAQARIESEAGMRTEIGAYAGPEARPLAERCLLSFSSSGGPPMLPILYNNHYQIVQSPGYVMILVEMVHDARIIKISDERSAASPALNKWMGDSIGRWEGDTLIVETKHYNPWHLYRGAPTENLIVIETFRRDGNNKLIYGFTVADPSVYTAQWSGEYPLSRIDEPIYEYACHEGNYGIIGILAGARRLESLEEAGVELGIDQE